jgi:hypothetical protein
MIGAELTFLRYLLELLEGAKVFKMSFLSTSSCRSTSAVV